MSHVVAIKTEVFSLEAVKRACKVLGLTFHENQKTIRWFGRWVNDYDAADAAYRLGIQPEDYGKSDHAISVPGSDYDVALLKNPATGGYKIYFDFWGGHGHRLMEVMGGQSGDRFVQEYAAQAALIEAEMLGYYAERKTLADGTIEIAVTGC